MSLWGFVPWWQIYFLDSLLLGIPAQNSANQKAYISYTYGADGNRVKKFVNTKPAFAGGVIDKNTITDPTAVTITWYLRDASGNIMAVYEQNHAESGTGYKAILRQAEVPLYGSDRLGMYKPALTRSLFEPEFAANAEIPIFELSSLTNTASATTFYATRLVGQKYYELKDHLGNIRAVVTDQLTAAADVEVTSASNYYPFGMLQPGNSAQSKDYRFGFNGKEMDNDMGHGTGNMYDYGFRIYNPRIGKFLSVDPLFKSYPSWTPYSFAMNRVIDGIDLDGLEYLKADEARIEMYCGAAYIKLENFNDVTRNWWNFRDNYEKSPDGYIGWPRRAATIDFPSIPISPEAANLDNGLSGYSDVMQNPTLHQQGGPLRKDWKTIDRRYTSYKPGTVSGASTGAKGYAVGMIVLNSINWSVSTWIASEMNEDQRLVDEHVGVLAEKVWPAIQKAIDANDVIPNKYMNIKDLGNIAQVILTGENPTDDNEIYQIGMRIFNEYGEDKPKKFETFNIPNTSSDVDATDVNKTIIIQTQ